MHASMLEPTPTAFDRRFTTSPASAVNVKQSVWPTAVMHTGLTSPHAMDSVDEHVGLRQGDRGTRETAGDGGDHRDDHEPMMKTGMMALVASWSGADQGESGDRRDPRCTYQLGALPAGTLAVEVLAAIALAAGIAVDRRMSLEPLHCG